MKSLLLCVPCLPLLVGCSGTPELTRFEYVEMAMASPARLVLYAADEKTARQAARDVYDDLHVLDQTLSDWKEDSELNKLIDATPEAIEISEMLHSALVQAKLYHTKTSGAFDPTVGPIVEIWRDARKIQTPPDMKELEDAHQLVDMDAVHLQPGTAQITRVGIRIDLGGIGKGIALDRAGKILRSRKIMHHLIDLDGDIQVGAAPPDSHYWMIAVLPTDEAAPMNLHLTDTTVSTSGDLYQFIELDGIRYSHIVDPRTGMALTERRQVTAIAPNGTQSDALATAGAVLTTEELSKLIQSEFPDTSAIVTTYGPEKDTVTLIGNPPVHMHDAP